jgi:hypothetical protein
MIERKGLTNDNIWDRLHDDHDPFRKSDLRFEVAHYFLLLK